MEAADDFGDSAYRQARQLYDEGKVAEAAPLFAASAASSPHYKYVPAMAALLEFGN